MPCDDLNCVIEETNELQDTRYFGYDAVGDMDAATIRHKSPVVIIVLIVVVIIILLAR